MALDIDILSLHVRLVIISAAGGFRRVPNQRGVVMRAGELARGARKAAVPSVRVAHASGIDARRPPGRPNLDRWPGLNITDRCWQSDCLSINLQCHVIN